MKTWKRLAIAGAACAAFAAPAVADTIKEVTTKGVIVTIDQFGAVDITYKVDGTFVGKNEQLEAAIGGPLTGKWRIEGDKLCTTADIMPTETCQTYPKDKKSGDEFEITSDQGTAKVKIK
jgi:hypothetical protein